MPLIDLRMAEVSTPDRSASEIRRLTASDCARLAGAGPAHGGEDLAKTVFVLIDGHVQAAAAGVDLGCRSGGHIRARPRLDLARRQYRLSFCRA